MDRPWFRNKFSARFWHWCILSAARKACSASIFWRGSAWHTRSCCLRNIYRRYSWKQWSQVSFHRCCVLRWSNISLCYGGNCCRSRNTGGLRNKQADRCRLNLLADVSQHEQWRVATTTRDFERPSKYLQMPFKSLIWEFPFCLEYRGHQEVLQEGSKANFL